MKTPINELMAMVWKLMEIQCLPMAMKARLCESDLDKIISLSYPYPVYANTLQALLIKKVVDYELRRSCLHTLSYKIRAKAMGKVIDKKVTITEEGIKLAAPGGQQIFNTKEVIQEAFGLTESGVPFCNNLVWKPKYWQCVLFWDDPQVLGTKKKDVKVSFLDHRLNMHYIPFPSLLVICKNRQVLKLMSPSLMSRHYWTWL
ncbi:hypothetical protein R1flu_004228 [Riccia fluitans]|uniref:Uncharacterized protein n=1 Tax=Riccia fluitans TaxID=41844 RepID=A0ABD1YPN6_9MARC